MIFNEEDEVYEDDHQRRTNMFYMEGRTMLCPLGLQRLQNDVT